MSAAAATVSEILEDRLHAGEMPVGLTGLVSVLLHGSFVVALVFISRPRPIADVPASVPVRIVPGGQLVRSRAQPVPAAPPKPVVAAEKPKPVIEKPQDLPPPSAKAMPAAEKPRKVDARPTPPPPPATAQKESSLTPDIDIPRAEAEAGTEGPGKSSFGTSVSALDTEFPYSYYVEQFLQLIGANWFKPDVAKGTACVVFFKIQSTGQITDIKIEQASGLPFYDREATRSLYKANPLPPLPPEYKSEYLGVHLRFQ